MASKQQSNVFSFFMKSLIANIPTNQWQAKNKAVGRSQEQEQAAKAFRKVFGQAQI